MEINVKANFNKMQKDSKKELVQFYLKGEAEQTEGLQELCREIVTISVNGLAPLTAQFNKIGKDSNKTVIDFVINPGAANEHKKEYYALVGKDIELTLEGTDKDPKVFKEELKSYHESLKNENEAKAAEDPNQTTIEQYIEDDLPFTDPPNDDEDELF